MLTSHLFLTWKTAKSAFSNSPWSEKPGIRNDVKEMILWKPSNDRSYQITESYDAGELLVK